MRHFISIAGCVLALAIPIGSTAHHAFSAEFDKDRPLQLEGTVTKVRWINPHAWIYIETQDDEGTATEWMIEGGTPNALMRTGITRKSLPVGSEIVVSGYQSKDRSCRPACKANGRDMTFADGRKLFMGSSGTGAPIDGSDPTD
ncbi:MAG: hypothetical protein ACI9ON_000876 [Limisphaerales bacterium]|jgi:hypothetical protein